jgi:hypothetical protein
MNVFSTVKKKKYELPEIYEAYDDIIQQIVDGSDEDLNAIQKKENNQVNSC